MGDAANDCVVKVDPEIADMVPLFLENRARDLEELRQAMARGDAQALRSIGHTLLGVGGSYGFPAISELGARIESAAIGGGHGELARAVEELADYLARVRVEIGGAA